MLIVSCVCPVASPLPTVAAQALSFNCAANLDPRPAASAAEDAKLNENVASDLANAPPSNSIERGVGSNGGTPLPVVSTTINSSIMMSVSNSIQRNSDEFQI